MLTPTYISVIVLAKPMYPLVCCFELAPFFTITFLVGSYSFIDFIAHDIRKQLINKAIELSC